VRSTVTNPYEGVTTAVAGTVISDVADIKIYAGTSGAEAAKTVDNTVVTATSGKSLGVEITTASTKTPKCMYYDTKSSNWSETGVTTSAKAGSAYPCKSDHLTAFALVEPAATNNTNPTNTGSIKLIFNFALLAILGFITMMNW